MSLDAYPRHDPRPYRRPLDDEPVDELAMDRPGSRRWLLHDDPGEDRRDEERAIVRPVIVSPAPAPRGPLDAASRLVGLLVKLALLLILLAILWAIVSVVGVGLRAPTTVGEQVGAALERGAGVAAAIGQRVADTFDPAHPPRSALAQDVEIDELLRLNVGAEVPGAATRTVTVQSIERRADAESPDAAVYAVLHSELKVPEETKVLGVTVRSSREPRDHYLYKGETIRIGKRLYKANWISIERQQVALVAYRDQDRVTAKLKAEID